MKKLPRLTHKTHGVCRIARADISSSGFPVFHVVLSPGSKRMVLSAHPMFWEGDPEAVFDDRYKNSHLLKLEIPKNPASIDFDELNKLLKAKKEPLWRELTCTKCEESFKKDWWTYSQKESALCDACKPPKAPEKVPIEGETFAGLRRVTNKHGKASSYFLKSKRNMDQEIYFEHLPGSNEESAVREWLFAPDQIKAAANSLAAESIRKTQSRLGIQDEICVESVSRGRKEIVRLASSVDQELETTLCHLSAGFIPKQTIKRSARKCGHGNWMSKNDRRGYSRCCSACNPGWIQLPKRNGYSDSEIVAAYDDGKTVTQLASQLKTKARSIASRLVQAGVILREEDSRHLSRKRPVKRRSAKDRAWKRVSDEYEHEAEHDAETNDGLNDARP